MLNELYTFAEPVQVVPFSNLKWGKFTLLHTYVEGESTPIETHAVKRGAYTNHFNKSPKVIYDKCLSDLFVIKEKAYINEDW